MNDEHGNGMEKNSLPTGKDASSENIRQEMPADGNDSIRDDVTEKKPGAILAARRIEAGISEEQIAARLKMTLRQVHYLETDNYDALHGIAISRGFVRAYARVLKIDPEPLVALFGDRTIPSPSSRNKVSSQKTNERFVQNRVPFRKKSNIAGKLLIALIVLVVAAVVAWNMKLFSFGNKQGKKETMEMNLPKPLSQPLPAVRMSADVKEQGGQGQGNLSQNSDVPKTAQPVDASAGNTSTNNQNEGVVQPVMDKNNQTVPVSGMTQKEPAGSVAAVAGDKSSLLTMDFREKSWIKVQKKDGSVIAEYIGKPGEQRQLEINEPVTIIVGFAPGVTMAFRGNPVDLAPNTVNSVARISLK